MSSHEEGEAPEPSGTVGVGREARALGRLHHLEDHLSHAKERLPHRASRGGPLAAATQVEARRLQRRDRAFESGRHHHHVVDGNDAVGMGSAGRRRTLGRCWCEAVEIE